ncbi:polysaccharide deacetylase family protein [Kitasatospora sp. NPDC050543]|uniref:polysaccharide deacetylase family protein n=1 Tax=Kitasatospora sp. NPDC050543 TaxID=3364054 RepID=UPI0037B1417C
MTADRRTLLRSTAKLAAMSAVGALAAACGDTPAHRSGPSELAVRPGTVEVQPTDPGPVDPPIPGPGPTTAAATPAPSPSPTVTASGTASAQPTPPTPPTLTPLAAGTPFEVVNGPRDRRLVALTFHGAGDPAMATRLLEVAEQRGARLTVMAIGSWLDQQPQMARRILDGGHELGNHTQNHQDIGAMSPAQAREEIARCAQRLQQLTGSIGRWFRPSAAQYATPMVREQAKAVGYEHVLSFDVDPRDYNDPSADTLQRRVLSGVRGGSVVALHMGHQCTIDALPAILDGLAKSGLSAVTASQLCA